MANGRKNFRTKTRKNGADQETRKARQKKRTKMHFKSFRHAIVTFSKGSTVTVIGSIPKYMSNFASLSKTRKGTFVQFQTDLIATVDGNGLKNSFCHQILFCRPDEKESGKKVFAAKGLTYNQYDIKTMSQSEEESVHISKGYTAALLYRGEFLVPDPTKQNYFWITNKARLKQRANKIRRRSQSEKNVNSSLAA